MTKQSSVYEVGLEIHNALKKEFLEGKTIRQLALEHGMQPVQILNFMRWAAREYAIERRMRADVLAGTLMRLSQAILDRALHQVARPDGSAGAASADGATVSALTNLVDKVQKMHDRLTRETEEWQERQGARRRFRKRPGEPQGSPDDHEELPFADEVAPSGAFDRAVQKLDGTNKRSR